MNYGNFSKLNGLKLYYNFSLITIIDLCIHFPSRIPERKKLHINLSTILSLIKYSRYTLMRCWGIYQNNFSNHNQQRIGNLLDNIPYLFPLLDADSFLYGIQSCFPRTEGQ